MQSDRTHIETILIEQNVIDSSAVFVSVSESRAAVGIGIMGGGDVEVWVRGKDLDCLLGSLHVVMLRTRTEHAVETFSEIFIQQTDDFGDSVPGFLLVTNRQGQIGLYAAVQNDGGGQVWLTVEQCETLVAALQAAGQQLATDLK